ncbi:MULTISPECIES: hypothetical protein [Psychrobacter]|uniref:hypothetical protein n=1 Tax=Psychrobacter TaxID=497 RepID=UPI00146CE6A1|nr:MULTISPECIES: hypothetical protein [Psychrobacter]
MANINRSTALQASELLGQIVEVIIDNQTLSDGLMKDLPVLGTILGISNIYNNFKAKSFEKKFKNFLLEFDDTEELQRFKDFIDKKEDEELGEVILNVIDKIDKNIQAKMLARAVKLYIYDQSQEENAKKIFDYNIYVIKILDDYLLSGIESVYGENSCSRVGSVDIALFNLGLMDQEQKPNYLSKTQPLISFARSDKGYNFYRKIVLGDIIDY